MPLSKWANRSTTKWDSTYTDFIVPALTEAGDYESERSKIRNGAFTEDIIKNLKNSYIVIADITGYNPNVMWELGIRQTLSNRTILICRQSKAQQKNISDMGIYGVIFYKDDAGGVIKFKQDIKEILEGIEKEPERIDNPVHHFLKREELIILSSEKKRITNQLIGLMSELLLSLYFCDGVKSGQYSISDKKITLNRMPYDAVTHLLVTNYVPVDKGFYTNLRFTKLLMIQINRRIDIASQDLQSGVNVDERNKKDLMDDIKNASTRLIEIIKTVKNIINSIDKIDLTGITAPLISLKEYDHLLE